MQIFKRTMKVIFYYYCYFKKKEVNYFQHHISLPAGEFCMLSCRLLIFFPKSLNTLSEIPSVSNCLDQDHVRYFVRPDPGPNCLQTLS